MRVPSFTALALLALSSCALSGAMPLEQFAQLVACRSVTIALDQVNAPFNGAQLEALRDFAAGLRAP